MWRDMGPLEVEIFSHLSVYFRPFMDYNFYTCNDRFGAHLVPNTKREDRCQFGPTNTEVTGQAWVSKLTRIRMFGMIGRFWRTMKV